MTRKPSTVARSLLAGSAAAVMFLTACGPSIPSVPEEDAGDASYMRQAVPILHGRKIRGYDEVKLLGDLAQLTSRDTVLRALMQQDDYRLHWAEVLTDNLQAHREGARSQTTCFGAPLRVGAHSDALSTWIRTQAPSGVSAPLFNMSDVLYSGLKDDHLFSVYAAHLFALQNRPGFDTEQAMRDTLGATFGKVYLHREMLCLSCHNSEYSLSGESSGWNRTHPIPGYFERALYGAPEGEPTDDAFAVFRTDVRGGVGGGSSPISPWGMSGCGTFDQTLPNDPLGISAYFTGSLGMQASIFTARSRFKSGYNGLDADGLQRTLEPGLQEQCAFCAENCSGDTLDVADVANGATNAATVKNLLTNTVWSGGQKCIDCHGGTANLYLTTGNDWANDLIGVNSSQQPALKLVDPGNANNSYLVKKLEGTGSGSQMPFGATSLSNAQINQIKAWINSMPMLTACATCSSLNCSQPRRYVAGTEAFTFLTAANIVNNVWTEAMGHPLTIANYYPRNSSQRNALWNLTEYRFIPNDWSLQDLLARSLTTNYFNRTAPQFSTLDSPYVIPPLLDPWSVADPRVPPVSELGYSASANPQNHKNAMGEGVHRYSARSLLNSIHKALGWPAPQRFPSGVTYPNVALNKAIGQFFTDVEPGSRTASFQGLLHWESVHGACAKPPGVAIDWINRVMTQVSAFSPAEPGGPLKVEDLVVVLRDWLLGHGGIAAGAPVDLTDTEAQALAAFFGVGSLNANANTVTDLEGKLRGLCGVMVETPQFWLAGIAPQGLGPKPRLRACNGGPCTYQEICQALQPAVNSLLPSGQTLICGTDSVNLLPVIPPWIVTEICPRGLCGPWFEPIPPGCWPGPPPAPEPIAGATKVSPICPDIRPPVCDPRIATPEGCGGPLPPIDRRGRMNMLVWADGAEVRTAENVLIRRQGTLRMEALRPGQQLKTGDLIALRPGSRLLARADAGEFKTPREGLPKQAAAKQGGALFMLVTGEQAMQPRELASKSRTPPLEDIKRIRAAEWTRRGEAGAPLTVKEFQSYRYPKEELGIERLNQRGLEPTQGEHTAAPPLR